jgi:predicted transcriptional regulator
MKQISIKMLDDKDLDFIEELRNLKVSKRVASLIAYLANGKEASSREIEIGANMRQPDVSIAMNALRENNWIEQRNINRAEGKGRPMILYKLNVPLETIITHFEEKSNRESTQAMESIQKLRELTTV